MNPHAQTPRRATAVQSVAVRASAGVDERNTSLANGSAIRSTAIEKSGALGVTTVVAAGVKRGSALPRLISNANGTRNFNDAMSQIR
jgi:hypothetical protein